MSAVYDYGEIKREEGIKEGMKEGRKEGIKEGIKEGREEIILTLYKSGMNTQEIAEKTKIDIKQIEKIINTSPK